jgi:hypothetical protein
MSEQASTQPGAMLEWLERRRLDLMAAYRAVLVAEGQALSAEQLNDAVDRWSEFALGRSRSMIA